MSITLKNETNPGEEKLPNMYRSDRTRWKSPRYCSVNQYASCRHSFFSHPIRRVACHRHTSSNLTGLPDSDIYKPIYREHPVCHRSNPSFPHITYSICVFGCCNMLPIFTPCLSQSLSPHRKPMHEAHALDLSRHSKSMGGATPSRLLTSKVAMVRSYC